MTAIDNTTPDDLAPERVTDLADRIARDPELAATFDMAVGHAFIMAQAVTHPTAADPWEPTMETARKFYLSEWDADDLAVAEGLIVSNPSIGLGELNRTLNEHREQRGVKTGSAHYATAEEIASLDRALAKVKASIAKRTRRPARTTRCAQR